MRLIGRVRSLFNRRRLDTDIQREIAHHVAMETERRQKQGMSPEEARRTALRDFGGVGRVREEVRDERGMTFFDTLAQDLRFGFRTLRRSPGYTTAAMVILGLGIGANTAMFSVISGVLIKPLPFKSGDELVLVQQSAPKSTSPTPACRFSSCTTTAKRLRSVSDLVEHHGMNFTLLNQGEPDRVNTGVVSANFFDMLGIVPLHGRTFRDGDDDLGAEAVLMLSYEYWMSKFGGDKSVVGARPGDEQPAAHHRRRAAAVPAVPAAAGRLHADVGVPVPRRRRAESRSRSARHRSSCLCRPDGVRTAAPASTPKSRPPPRSPPSRRRSTIPCPPNTTA